MTGEIFSQWGLYVVDKGFNWTNVKHMKLVGSVFISIENDENFQVILLKGV